MALRPAEVLDVGCGTGKAAVQFAARGLPVLGVEVDEQMAEVARGHGIPVEVGSFETWEDAGRQFDLITCAQAWHWVDPVPGVAKAARVLRPGGAIARFWNYHEFDPPVRAAFDAVYGRYAPQLKVPGHWQFDRSHADPFAEQEGFARVVSRDYRWEQTYPAEQWVRLVATYSDHLRLAPADLAAVQAALRAAIGDLGGTLEVHYGTFLQLAHRTGTDR